MVFVQFTCEQAAADQAAKFNMLITSESIAILIGFLFYCLIRGLYQGGKLGVVEWDLATVTAGDYTIMWEITKETYEAWDEERENDPVANQIPEGYAFKDKIKTDLEKMLSDALAEYKRTQGADLKYESMVDKDHVKIANIAFGYDNPELIYKLRARGSAIALHNWPAVSKLDAELIALMEDDDMREKFSRPILAYITFEEEDGYLLALDFSAE